MTFSRRTFMAVTLSAAAGGTNAAADEARWEAAYAYSLATGGDAMLVRVAGRTVFERYAAGRSPEKLASLASGTKSFWGPACAAMIADGLIESFDEPVVRTLPEWRDDPVRSRITLRHVLSLTSGLQGDSEALQGQGSAPDKYAHAIRMPAAAAPGARFVYGPVNFYVLGEVMRRKLHGTGQDPLAYLHARILAPLGITRYDWLRDPAGNPHIPNGCSLTARDWATYGAFLLGRGRAGDRQLVPAALLDACLQPSSVNPAYGLTIWLNAPGGVDLQGRRPPDGAAGGTLYTQGRRDLFAALGAGRNGLYVIPGLQTVIVRQRPYEERPPGMPFAEHAARMRTWQGRFADREFLRLALG